MSIKFSFIILYYNRYEYLIKIVNDIAKIERDDIEVIVVDNHSEIDAGSEVNRIFSNIKYIRLDNNFGAVARNRGIDCSNGDYIVCLDDDVLGIGGSELIEIEKSFDDSKVAALCFKVINPDNGDVINWIHHYDKRIYSNLLFETNEISEGAVCFRNKVLHEVGLYYEKFFISHEGPDLACRILNNNYDIRYNPNIVVRHYHSNVGRMSWRRYYYDTRNTLWLCVRNFPLYYAIKKILWGIIPMLVYSLRDGFFRYWVKGIYDGVKDLPEVLIDRKVVSHTTLIKIIAIEANRPNVFNLIKGRLFQKKVKI